MPDAAREKPMLLIAMEEEWAGRSLESVLVAHGYGVLRAADGRDALAWAKRVRPDAIILDLRLPTIDGIEVCEQLRADARFDASTPIVVAASTPATYQLRSKAYSAGAWEFCTHPIDTDTLLLKLTNFVRARHAALAAARRADFDDSTGVLTPRGLEHWAEHVGARAARNHEPLACVILMPITVATAKEREAGGDARTASMQAFLEIARDVFRRSDIVGSTADGRLALLAPDTDEEGVHGFLARLRGALAKSADAQPMKVAPQFKAGYWAVEDFSAAAIDPMEVVRRAIKSMDGSSDGQSFSGFSRLPLS